jgi:hypothetical protein
MKTTRIFKMIGIVLLGMMLTLPVPANEPGNRPSDKKAIIKTVDKPVLEFIARVFADHVKSNDIIGVQKTLGEIDHVTISFRDEDASDYVLNFKPLDEKQLEVWLFDEGYLSSDYQAGPEIVVPWMQNMHLN